MARMLHIGRGARVAAAVTAAVLVAATVGYLAVGATSPPPSSIHLHLGGDARFFAYGSTVQNLTTQSNNCKIASPTGGAVMQLTATGAAGAAPGLNGADIGVRVNSSGNGTPCGQVDSTESITLTPGTAVGSRTFSSVQLDLEMTGNAKVKLTLNTSPAQTYYLETGTSIEPAQTQEPGYDTTAPYNVASSPGDSTDACAAPNSSGPNSGFNDNCEWLVQPGAPFTSVTLTTVSAGTVSLEGSNDFGNNPAYDTVFNFSNSAPTAANDSYGTNEDTQLTVNAPGVLTNDSDPDGNPITAVLDTPPLHAATGAFSLHSDGSFVYTPAANYNGSDSFTYHASDGALSSSTVTVALTVNPVNDPPVAQSGSYSTPEDTAVTITAATDIDSSVIHVSCTGAQGGTVIDHGDGSITFTPPLNYDGQVTLTCTATDGSGAQSTSSATIVVTATPVNDPPVAVDDTAEVLAGSSVPINVVANDTDVDGDPLTATNVTDPAHGSVSVNGGIVTYTPDPYSGTVDLTDTFTYTANDGTVDSANTATVTVTVHPAICSNDTVTTSDQDVSGSFTRLTDNAPCKAYNLSADTGTDSVLFSPNDPAHTLVDYRAFVDFGPDVPNGNEQLTGTIRYDPAGGTNYRPMQYCIGPHFDANGNVSSIDQMPAGETWCIANALVTPDANGVPSTTWQLFGNDDPHYTR